jgi:hypothetical protein
MTATFLFRKSVSQEKNPCLLWELNKTKQHNKRAKCKVTEF